MQQVFDGKLAKFAVVFEFALAVGAELAEDKAEHIYFDHWHRAMGQVSV